MFMLQFFHLCCQFAFLDSKFIRISTAILHTSSESSNSVKILRSGKSLDLNAFQDTALTGEKSKNVIYFPGIAVPGNLKVMSVIKKHPPYIFSCDRVVNGTQNTTVRYEDEVSVFP